MNWKYISRFLLGIVLGLTSMFYYSSIFQGYPRYSSYLEFGHPSFIEKFLLINFNENILMFVLIVYSFLAVLLIDLMLMIFKGKKILKYTLITLLGEIIFLFILLTP